MVVLLCLYSEARSSAPGPIVLLSVCGRADYCCTVLIIVSGRVDSGVATLGVGLNNKDSVHLPFIHLTYSPKPDVTETLLQLCF